MPSIFESILSKQEAVFLATALTNRGSKRAVSISLIMSLAMFVPSLEPGDTLVAPEKL